MTTAETIAAAFDNDGTCWTNHDGQSLDEACFDAHGAVSRDGSLVRYRFPDDSAIVSAPGGWDIEGATPFSWRSCPL